ncbi:uncharacterized protein LOC127239245 [Andrographis paniculata]|uniref:uncharacterized protein LOC127239245 n=1 Tax=Andrographis paniculata TaxID=175694 RepID=UPI0021E9A429|nr:uncharacterized protein LOC127239245 [Andrographis paniculata]
MVNTRGKKKSESLNKTKNEASENASTEKQTSESLIAKMEGKHLGAELEDKEATVDENIIKIKEALCVEETEKAAKVDYYDENTVETGSFDVAESDKYTSENDEMDDQEDELTEDDDEDSERDGNPIDEDEVDEDEAIEDDDEDDDWDKPSEEKAIEEDSEEIEYSDEESMEDVSDEHAQNDEELAIVVRKDTEVQDVQKVKVSSKTIEEPNQKSGKLNKIEKLGERSEKLKKNEKSGEGSGRLKKIEEPSEGSEKLKKIEESSKRSGKLKKIEESSGRSKMKVQAQRLKKMESRDKPESSSKQKRKKRVESMGMIFMCSSKTKKDCYQYKVLGLPESKKDIVEKIYAGMRLFLYDVDLKLLYGIYKAAGPGGFNIEPRAFKSQFPSQVRFTTLDDCLPLPEEKFKKVIKDNYFTKSKFDCKLNSDQVKALCRMFVASSKGKRPKRVSRPEKEHPVQRDRARKQRVGDKRRREPEDDPRYNNRSPKHSRRVSSSVVALRRSPSALAPMSPPHAYGRTTDVDPYGRASYLDGRSHYRERKDRIIRPRESYRDLRDLDLVSRYPARSDPYYLPLRDGRDSYLDRSSPYRDERDHYIVGIRESYRDSYADRRLSYIDRPYSVAYSSNKSDPLSGRDDVYRGIEFSDSYRRELFEHDDDIRRRRGIGSRDLYPAAYQQPSYVEPVYSAEYPSRTVLAREYHI